MKKLLPFIIASAISLTGVLASLQLADPELGVSTALLSWMGCLWLISADKKNQRCPM